MKPPDDVWFYVDTHNKRYYYGDIRWVRKRVADDRKWRAFHEKHRGKLPANEPQCWKMTPDGWVSVHWEDV